MSLALQHDFLFCFDDVALHQVEFCVENSRGSDSRTCRTRTVSVTPGCPTEEVLCSDLLECSVGGICPSDLLFTGSTAEELAAGNDVVRSTPPVLHLLGSKTVQLKRGTLYRKCGPEDLGAEAGAAQCDEGVVSVHSNPHSA